MIVQFPSPPARKPAARAVAGPARRSAPAHTARAPQSTLAEFMHGEGHARRRSRPARTQAMASAQRMFAAHAQAERHGIPVAELLGAEREQRACRRRERVTRAASCCARAPRWPAARLPRQPVAQPRALARTVAGAADRDRRRRPGRAALRPPAVDRTPKQAVRGDRLRRQPERAGGRCWTLRGFFSDGLISEHGGSFINSEQLPIRRLAAQLGLQEELVLGGDLPQRRGGVLDRRRLLHRGGSERRLGERRLPRLPRGAAADRALAAQEAELDAMSVSEWLDSTEIGSGSRFGKLMIANTVTENGGDPDEQSALDVIELTSGKHRSALLPLPGDDERFHIVGGNDQLIRDDRAAAVRRGPARPRADRAPRRRRRDDDARLRCLRQHARSERRRGRARAPVQHAARGRPLELGPVGGQAARDPDLRHGLEREDPHRTRAQDLAGARLQRRDLQRIRPLLLRWDDSVQLGADASPALFLGYPGGTGRAQRADRRSPRRRAGRGRRLAARADRAVFPGTSAAYSGRAYEDHWALDPWVKGAYSFYAVGQAASYGALARAREGNIYFAGEHTSIANEGFLDGAVESGERVARSLLSRLA